MSAEEYRLKRVDVSLSAAIVRRLQREGRTLKQIGDMMGLTHAFISQVKSGKKSLTIARLEMLEKALNRPLPIIFLQAVEESPRPKGLERSYRHLTKVLGENVGDG